jgi:hypothetical protein
LRVAALIFLIGPALAWGSPQDSARHRNFRSYPDHMFVYPLIKQRSKYFEIQRRNTENPTLEFRPNHAVSMGVGLYIFEVLAELSVNLPPNPATRDLYGDSNVRDLFGQVVGHNWSLDFFTQRYEGFYLTDLPRLSPVDNGILLRPDVMVRSFGVNGLYIFNRDKFSIRSAYNFAERQLKSGGSWMLSGTVTSSTFSSDTVLLTHRLQNLLSLQTTYHNLQYTTLSVAPGYTYNFIFKNWFLNFSLAIGPAHHWVNYTDHLNRQRYDIVINSFVDNRVALGYNSDRWFGGISFVNLARQVKFAEFQVTTNATNFSMMVGYRIPEEGIFKKRAWDFVPIPQFLKGRQI